MKMFVLVRDSGVMGAVVDPAELARLMYDPDAMPSDAQLSEHEVELLSDGRLVSPGLNELVEVPAFSLAAWNAATAEDDIVIASMPEASRARLHPGHRPEAEKRAARAAERAARVTTNMLARQDTANAEALGAALEAAAAHASDWDAAREAVATITREDKVAARAAARAAEAAARGKAKAP